MDISNYQSITNLFDVPLERIQVLTDMWKQDKHSLSLDELEEMSHYAKLRIKKLEELNEELRP